MDKKEFALGAIAPYVLDPKRCAITPGGDCAYELLDGRRCVAGKYMLHPELMTNDITNILDTRDQSDVFRPEVVGILTNGEWKILQNLHDTIATRGVEKVRDMSLGGLFTYKELMSYVEDLK